MLTDLACEFPLISVSMIKRSFLSSTVEGQVTMCNFQIHCQLLARFVLHDFLILTSGKISYHMRDYLKDLIQIMSEMF